MRLILCIENVTIKLNCWSSRVIDQEKIAIAGKSKLTSQSEKAFTFQYDNYNTYAQVMVTDLCLYLVFVLPNKFQ